MARCWSSALPSGLLGNAQEKEYELEHVLQRLAGKDAQTAAAQRAEEVAIVSLSCLPAIALCAAKSTGPTGAALQRTCSHHSMASLICVNSTLARHARESPACGLVTQHATKQHFDCGVRHDV